MHIKTTIKDTELETYTDLKGWPIAERSGENVGEYCKTNLRIN